MAAGLDRPWTDEDVARVRKYAAWHRIENYQEHSSQFVRKLCERRSEA